MGPSEKGVAVWRCACEMESLVVREGVPAGETWL